MGGGGGGGGGEKGGKKDGGAAKQQQKAAVRFQRAGHIHSEPRERRRGGGCVPPEHRCATGGSPAARSATPAARLQLFPLFSLLPRKAALEGGEGTERASEPKTKQEGKKKKKKASKMRNAIKITKTMKDRERRRGTEGRESVGALRRRCAGEPRLLTSAEDGGHRGTHRARRARPGSPGGRGGGKGRPREGAPRRAPHRAVPTAPRRGAERGRAASVPRSWSRRAPPAPRARPEPASEFPHLAHIHMAQRGGQSCTHTHVTRTLCQEEQYFPPSILHSPFPFYYPLLFFFF